MWTLRVTGYAFSVYFILMYSFLPLILPHFEPDSLVVIFSISTTSPALSVRIILVVFSEFGFSRTFNSLQFTILYVFLLSSLIHLSTHTRPLVFPFGAFDASLEVQ